MLIVSQMKEKKYTKNTNSNINNIEFDNVF